MLIAATLYFVSLGARMGWWPIGGDGAAWIAGIGLLFVVVGAYLGGDLVFNIGSQVDRHAWRGGGTKWQAIDLDSVRKTTHEIQPAHMRSSVRRGEKTSRFTTCSIRLLARGRQLIERSSAIGANAMARGSALRRQREPRTRFSAPPRVRRSRAIESDAELGSPRARSFGDTVSRG